MLQEVLDFVPVSDLENRKFCVLAKCHFAEAEFPFRHEVGTLVRHLILMQRR